MKRFFLALTALFLLCGEGYACTSAIVAAQRSSEGVPILWKHRDNSFDNTRIEYVDEYGYAYTAVTKNMEGGGKYVYAGINEAGLGFITTATSNMPAATVEEYKACKRRRMRGGTTWNGLTKCATVDEFEELLRKTKRGRKSKSNIGVADATGAVAYFEVWDLGYRRYDVSERGDAGFDVRTNFSHSRIKESKGATVRRYDLIMREMNNHKGAFSPWDFICYSRSYNTIRYGDVLKTDERYRCANHTVPRASSVGAFVLVCDGKNPRLLAMNGHPVSSIAVPVYVKAKHNIPKCVSGSTMQELSREFIAKAYTIVKSGKYTNKYLNKDVVREVLKIKQPKIKLPKEMPANIQAFNDRIDNLFVKHDKKVRKVLAKY
jgi:hypothetical protein